MVANSNGITDYKTRTNRLLSQETWCSCLEINVDDDQIDDLVDDAVQYFQERHYEGSEEYLKYQIAQDDIDRGRASAGGVGVVTTTGTSTIVGTILHLVIMRTLIISKFLIKYWGSTKYSNLTQTPFLVACLVSSTSYPK